MDLQSIFRTGVSLLAVKSFQKVEMTGAFGAVTTNICPTLVKPEHMVCVTACYSILPSPGKMHALQIQTFLIKVSTYGLLLKEFLGCNTKYSCSFHFPNQFLSSKMFSKTAPILKNVFTSFNKSTFCSFN